jgi:UPF0755 protein
MAERPAGRRLTFSRVLLVLVPVLILAVAAASLGLWRQYEAFKTSPLTLPAPTESIKPFLIDIPTGMSLRSLARELTALGLLDHPWFFLVLAHLSGQAPRIKAGEYEITPGTTPVALLDKLVRNQVYQRSITLIEGWTATQLLANLARDDRLVPELEGATPATLMTALGRPGQSPEGRFFPDTYHFTKGTSDLDLLKRAAQAMDQVLAEEWRNRAPGLPLESPEQALILASIIEKETGLASERAAIAGVFVRRLQLGMRLQTDPTVIFGLGEAFDGDLRRADLLRDTPYNTYTRTGLPPTPIALPGRAAIRAALHPAAGNSLYFVAKGDGSHWFSASLEEHNQAVRRFQLGGARPSPPTLTVPPVQPAIQPPGRPLVQTPVQSTTQPPVQPQAQPPVQSLSVQPPMQPNLEAFDP